MTSDTPTPNTPEALIRLALGARNRDGNPPVTTVFPDFRLNGEHAGLLDLTILVQQIIAAGRGASIVQMLHATAYLLDTCRDGLQDRIDQLQDQDERFDPQLNDIRQRVTEEIGILTACLTMLERVVQPVTLNLLRMGFQESPLPRTPAGVREFAKTSMVSRSVLEVLEIDPSAFDQHFFGDS